MSLPELSTTSSCASSSVGLLSDNASTNDAALLPVFDSSTVQELGRAAFGNSQFVNKEDFERARMLFTQRIEEVERKLFDSEADRQRLRQAKAQQTKRILELERRNAPLLDQSRRLTERNKFLTGELKKVELKLSHFRDDCLSLKDSKERLEKEIVTLKEKRAFPERLAELERYRNQVLEYSKCITALRHSAAEKDRRFELVIGKLRALRKQIKKGTADQDDDAESTVAPSEASSLERFLSLDNLCELDLEHNHHNGSSTTDVLVTQLQRDNDELRAEIERIKKEDDPEMLARLAASEAEVSRLKRELVNMISEQEMRELKLVILQQQSSIADLETTVERLRDELLSSREQNELLEFEVLEFRSSQVTATAKSISVPDSPPSLVDDLADVRQIEDTRPAEGNPPQSEMDAAASAVIAAAPHISAVQHQALLSLMERVDRLGVENRELLDQLERRLAAAEERSNQEALEAAAKIAQLEVDAKTATIELDTLRRSNSELVTKVDRLENDKSELQTKLNAKQSELDALTGELQKLASAENDRLSAVETSREENARVQAELRAAVSTAEAECSRLQLRLKSESARIRELSDRAEQNREQEKAAAERRQELESRLVILTNEAAALKIRADDAAQTERKYEEARKRLSEMIEKVEKYEAALSEYDQTRQLESTLEEMAQLRIFNEQLDQQFQAQMQLIDALKHKVVEQKSMSSWLASVCRSGCTWPEAADQMRCAAGSQRDEMQRSLLYAIADFLTDDRAPSRSPPPPVVVNRKPSILTPKPKIVPRYSNASSLDEHKSTGTGSDRSL